MRRFVDTSDSRASRKAASAIIASLSPLMSKIALVKYNKALQQATARSNMKQSLEKTVTSTPMDHKDLTSSSSRPFLPDVQGAANALMVSGNNRLIPSILSTPTLGFSSSPFALSTLDLDTIHVPFRRALEQLGLAPGILDFSSPLPSTPSSTVIARPLLLNKASKHYYETLRTQQIFLTSMHSAMHPGELPSTALATGSPYTMGSIHDEMSRTHLPLMDLDDASSAANKALQRSLYSFSFPRAEDMPMVLGQEHKSSLFTSEETTRFGFGTQMLRKPLPSLRFATLFDHPPQVTILETVEGNDKKGKEYPKNTRNTKETRTSQERNLCKAEAGHELGPNQPEIVTLVDSSPTLATAMTDITHTSIPDQPMPSSFTSVPTPNSYSFQGTGEEPYGPLLKYIFRSTFRRRTRSRLGRNFSFLRPSLSTREQNVEEISSYTNTRHAQHIRVGKKRKSFAEISFPSISPRIRRRDKSRQPPFAPLWLLQEAIGEAVPESYIATQAAIHRYDLEISACERQGLTPKEILSSTGGYHGISDLPLGFYSGVHLSPAQYLAKRTQFETIKKNVKRIPGMRRAQREISLRTHLHRQWRKNKLHGSKDN